MHDYIEKSPDDYISYSYYYFQKTVTKLFNDDIQNLGDLFNEYENIVQHLGNYERSAYLILRCFLHYELKQVEQMDKLVMQIREISDDEVNNATYNQFADLCEAMQLLLSSRSKHQGRAQELLEGIVYNDSINATTTNFALNFLLISLIKEMANSGDLKILEEIRFVIEKYSTFANKSNSKFAKIIVEIITAKVSIFEGDFESYIDHINIADAIALETTSKLFEKMVKEAKLSIEEDVEKLKDMIRDGASLKERLQIMNYNQYIESIVKYSISGV
ncbi:MAG: hypothetical protein IH840_06405 [Candidatus Heimdallarchaeota archaeon]|nr:hypothetical protein [Candidatus Heimdallarchaeota archaeon]